MALDRKMSLGVGLGSVAIVWGIYNAALPKVVDVRVAQPADGDLAAAEKTARWTSAAVVTGISLITMDATVFIFGAGAVVLFSWMHRHANAVSPDRGQAYMPTSRQMTTADMTGQSTGYTPGN